ncbi:MAG: peptidase S41, partial [Prevotellaceae bacterium]|nr:peptidase S41 [Prevotellaceae bacterium]
YCLEHPTIAPANQFTLTDADYQAFKEMVKASNFTYDQQSERLLKTLKEAAEFEGYMENASAAFDALEQKLVHNLDHDLDYFADDIKPLIAVEIVKRYYYQKGSIIEQLKNDPDLKAAVNVLQNSDEYKKILSAPAPSND